MDKAKEYIKGLILRAKTTDYKALAKQTAKDPIFWVRFSAYAIPLAFLLYVLYMNFLPFGYNKTFIIEVGGPTDTKVSEFYLEPAPSLSDRKVAPDGTPYRELSGSAFAIFEPKAILKDAVITVSVEGLDGDNSGISLIPPVINLDPSTIAWDHSWDFATSIPQDLKGNAFMFDGEATFNGRDTRLELPNSADMFEDGPFTVYAEWKPRDSENNAQQIVGHFNWELWQNKDSVEFRVGRMNDTKGPLYSIKYPVEVDFFNIKHAAIAIYNPGTNGYIDLYVDSNLAGRTYFGSDKIWKNYGNENLSFGWDQGWNYGKTPHFKGSIYIVNILSSNIIEPETKINFIITNSDRVNITILSSAISSLKQIKLNVSQR